MSAEKEEEFSRNQRLERRAEKMLERQEEHKKKVLEWRDTYNRNRREHRRTDDEYRKKNNAASALARKALRRSAKAHEIELAKRVLARRKLIHYIKKFMPGYQAGWVHHDICRRLETFVQDVQAGKAPRLMLFVPPRHGKSSIVSNFFVSWFLGQYPTKEIITASYAVTLPMKFSRRIRERIATPEHRALFPELALSRASSSVEEWETTAGGSYVAAGVGGGIAGKGADIFVIDDPVKDAEEADSETISDKVWDWYGSTAQSRLSPLSGMLVIQTRWSDTDLSGRLVTQMRELEQEGVPAGEIEPWEIIEYPAIATSDEWLNVDRTITSVPKDDQALLLRRKDEALHPERYNYDRLMRIKRTIQPRHWNALYQQNPVPDDGDYFTRDMFRVTRSAPPLHDMKVYVTADLAIGEKQQNDYTVFVVGGVDANDHLFVLDVLRGRMDAHAIVETLLNLHRKYKPQLIGLEKGQLEMAIRPQLKKRMRERRQYPAMAEGKRALMPVTDKMTRARPLQGRMQQGMVSFVGGQAWLDIAMAELFRFPVGVHDDVVDALAWMVRMIANETPPQKPAPRRLKSWRDKLAKHYVGDGSGDPMAA